MVTSFADGTKISFEQAIVANATGMTVAQRGMRGLEHPGHVDELDLDLRRRRARESRRCRGLRGRQPARPRGLRAGHPPRPAAAALSGAVQARSRDRSTASTRPITCVTSKCRRRSRGRCCSGDAAIAPVGAPTVEVVATAKQDLRAGTVLDGLGGYDTYGQAERADVTAVEDLLPMGLAEGARLRVDRPRDTVLRYSDVDLPGRAAGRSATSPAGGRVAHARHHRSVMFGIRSQPGGCE